MSDLKVLIACEESQTVCKAFRARGIEAFSCDIQPCSGGYPGWHMQEPVEDILHNNNWEMVIAFPPCTHLAVSGARWFPQKRADGTQFKAIEFFLQFTYLSRVKYVAIENPVGIMSTQYRKPDQIIQPWQFGHPESKKTCLWLQNLPPLQHTNVLPLPESGRWENQTPSGQNKLGPSTDRAKIRSTTYAGIAEAMAEQWGGLLK